MDAKSWEAQVAKFKTIAPPPDFVCCFPDNHHPQRKLITANVNSYFAERWAWRSVFEKENYSKRDLEGWLLSMIGDSDFTRAENATIWCAWLFLFDDATERMSSVEAKQALKRLTGIFSGGWIPEDVTPMEAMGIDIRRRVLEEEDKALRNFGTYLLQKASESFFGAACAKHDRAKSLTKGYDGYIEYRFKDIGAWVAIGIIFWTRGAVLPVELEASDLYSLYYDASIHAALVNDLYSYRMEANVLNDVQDTVGNDHEYVIFNSIPVLMAEKGISLEDAYAEIIERIHALEDKYIQDLKNLRLQYCRDGKDFSEVEKASAIFEDMMGGNITWSQVCGRYNLT